MTLNQTALKQTIIVGIGTVTLGITAGYLYTVWPEATKLGLIGLFFGWIT